MADRIRILHVDDNRFDRDLVRDAISQGDLSAELVQVSTLVEYEEQLRTREFDIVLCDVHLPGGDPGELDVLRLLAGKAPRLPFVVLTGTGSEWIAVEALKRGASDYVVKTPEHIRRLPTTIGLAVEKHRLVFEREVADARRNLAHRVLERLNAGGHLPTLLRETLCALREFTGCEMAGFRLRQGDDFPHFAASGTPDSPASPESRLCGRGEDGSVRRDGAGNPILEGMCGSILQGRFDPSLPFFTRRGSFFTNSTADFVSATAGTEWPSKMRYPCCAVGHESVALIPLRAGDEVVGLLQLNDRAHGCFSEGLIAFLEELCRDIGAAIGRRLAEEQSALNEARLASLWQIANYQAGTLKDLLDFALEEAIRLTRSTIGYVWHYSQEARKLVPCAWSKDVMGECSISPLPAVVDLDTVGLLGEPVRRRQPVVINDYQAPDSLNRGCPDGLAHLSRYLAAPVFSGERIVAVAAVANKETDYDDADVRQLRMLMESVWHIVERRNAQDAAAMQLARLTLLHLVARAVLERSDLPSVLRVVVDYLEHDLPADAVEAFLFDSATGQFRRLAPRDGPSGARPAADDANTLGGAGSEEFRALLVAGEAVYLPDTEVDPGHPGANLFPGAGIRCTLAVPMLVEDEVIGFLAVGRREVDVFTADERGFIGTVAEHCAVAAHHARVVDELRRAYDDLRHAQETVVQQERLRALGQMASGIAHDFNNALMPVVTYSDMPLSNPQILGDRQKMGRFFRRINAAAREAAAVVSRLGAFYRPRESNEPYGPVNLDEIIAQAVALTRPKWKDQAQARGTTIRVRTHHEGASLITGCASELREAITNLIFNAVDAMPEGGTMTLAARDGPSGRAVLDVSDTGIGMTDETRRRCLEPFYTTKGEQGSGLGLAMVYGTVARHQGAIEIESEPGQGTSFRIELPAYVPGHAVAEETAPSAPGRLLQILLVDDEDVVREALQDLLSADGHEVVMAVNGRDGLTIFSAGSFDLVITDRAMPEMGGDQLAMAIKQVAPGVPVIMLTGFGDFMQAHEEVPAGVDRVVGKPVNVRTLRDVLASLANAGP